MGIKGKDIIRILAFLAWFWLWAQVAFGNEIVWNGTGPLPTTVPSYTTAPQFYPGESPSANKVTVTYDLPMMIMGGYFFYELAGQSGQSSDNQIVIKGVGPIEVRTVLGALAAMRVSDPTQRGFGVFSTERNSIFMSAVSTDCDMTVLNPIYGAKTSVMGSGKVIGDFNKIEIENGSRVMQIIGVEHNLRALLANEKYYAQASHNEIIVRDSYVRYFVLGAYVINEAFYNNKECSESLGFLTHNSVTLEGSARVDGYVGGAMIGGAGAKLYNVTPGSDIFTGNRLNIVNPAEGGVQVLTDVFSFEEFWFTFPKDVKEGAIGLKAGRSVMLWDGYGVSSVIKGVEILGDGPPPQELSLTLIEAADIDDTLFIQDRVIGSYGGILDLTFDLELTTDSDQGVERLMARYVGATFQPQTETVPLADSVSLAFLNQGLDHVSGEGVTAVLNRPYVAPCLTTFATFGGSVSDYEESYELDGYYGLLGISCASFLESGTVTLGGFVEAGRGKYKTKGVFQNGREIVAKGDVEYIGGGLLGRFDFDGSKPGPGQGKNYLEASLRLGQTRTTFMSDDFFNVTEAINFTS
ncbi:MAG: hypothetical protein LBV23_08875, partial [Deltaproteobacteria bacterium]|nr:hypothetical protein [Deltaproteobacteria bacterium]